MSDDSVLGQANKGFSNPSNPLHVDTGGGFLGQTFGNALFGGPDPITSMWAQAGNSFFSKPSSPQTPGAPPTLGNSTMTALGNQLQQEVKMRASRTLFTSDLDSGVRTAGTELIGN